MMIPGAHQLPIPTPFQIGAINAYLLEGPPLTLIDVGPHTEEALQALQTQLAQRGYALEDIEQLLVTHPHIDHFGLASTLKARSGCQVVAHPDAVLKLQDFAGYYEQEQSYFGEFLVSMGMPEQTAQVLVQLPKSFAVLAPPVEVDQTIVEGDSLQVGKLAFQVLETPGHSLASLCFYEASHQALFVGDHLIHNITPNPLLEMPHPQSEEKPKSLVIYLQSLKKVAAFNLKVAFSGHRDIISNPQRVIELSFKHHQQRSGKVLDFVKEKPLTAFELMSKLFPNLPVTEQFLGMSEAVGHLEWLEATGHIRAKTDQNVIFFEPL